MKLATRPLLTQSVTTAVLFAAGDVLSQHAVEKVEKHDYARTGRMALYGGAIFGPAATTWFKFLQNRITLPNKNAEILARVGLDQGLFAGANLFCFLTSMSIMEGSDPKKKLDEAYWTALKKNWMLWPFVQVANFKFVPLDYRVLVVNVISLGWNCYLSYINSQSGSSEKGRIIEEIEEKIE
ncbi:MAG: Protein required for ethanol metabolism [Sarea resinae]|nr:MAG: Protein required for ethanol metabolism [Sarea resinae]